MGARWCSTGRAGRLLAASTVSCGLLSGAVACAAGTADRPRSVPGSHVAGTVRPEVPARPSTAPLASDVLAAYRRFWTVAESLRSRPPATWRSALAEVAAEPLLSRVHSGLLAERESGVEEYGSVVPQPRVVALDGHRAAVVDCQDASGSGEIDAATGLPRSVGSARTPVSATLVRGRDGRWRVSDARYLDGGC